MKFLMINIGVGLVQALALTLAAPLLLGIVFRLARIGRSGPADGLLFLYGRLGAARFHDLSLGPTAEFVCVFLAASMLPGFLGAKITFGDFTLLTALLGMAALTAALYGEGDGGSGVPQKQGLFEAGLFCAALFLSIACRGFHAMSTMLPDAAFQFRGTYLTGDTELAVLGFFSLLAAEGEGALRYFTGTRADAMTFWGAPAGPCDGRPARRGPGRPGTFPAIRPPHPADSCAGAAVPVHPGPVRPAVPKIRQGAECLNEELQWNIS